MLVTDSTNWPVLIVSATPDWSRAVTREGIDIIVRGIKRGADEGIRVTVIYRCTPNASPTVIAVMQMVKGLIFNRKVIRSGLSSTSVVYNKPEDLNFLHTLLKLYRPSRNVYTVDANADNYEEVLADIAEGKAVGDEFLIRAGRHL